MPFSEDSSSKSQVFVARLSVNDGMASKARTDLTDTSINFYVVAT